MILIIIVFSFLLIQYPLKEILNKNKYFSSSNDTRIQSFEWIKNNLPKFSKIQIDAYSPQISNNNYILESIPILSVEHIDRINYHYDISRLMADSINYIITSSIIKDRYVDREDIYPIPNFYYNKLDNDFDLIKEFSTDKQITSGPEIKIYQIKIDRKSK